MSEPTWDHLGAATAADGAAEVVGEYAAAADDQPARYNVHVAAHATFDATEPAQRAELEKLIAALQTAVAHGECVGWTGAPATQVDIGQPRIEWVGTVNGRTTRSVVPAR
jgi:hypothetical protein